MTPAADVASAPLGVPNASEQGAESEVSRVVT